MSCDSGFTSVWVAIVTVSRTVKITEGLLFSEHVRLTVPSIIVFQFRQYASEAGGLVRQLRRLHTINFRAQVTTNQRVGLVSAALSSPVFVPSG